MLGVLITCSGSELEASQATPICTNLAAGHLEATFHIFAASWSVGAVAVYPDNRVLVGTVFDEGITRLKTDGSLDESFDRSALRNFVKKPAVHVQAICIQNDEKVFVGAGSGDSEYWFGNYVVRLHTNGTVDQTFRCAINSSNTPPYSVRAILAQPDGRVLVVGRPPQEAVGVVPHGILRLLSDGTVDATFNPGTGTDGASAVTIALQKDGRIVVGGAFRSFNGTNRSGLARLHSDGSLDLSFVPDSRLSVGSIESIQLQPDGKIIAGGRLSDESVANHRGIVRLNQDGSLDSSFDPGTGAQSDDVENIKVVSLSFDSKIVIAGRFTRVNGIQRLGVARLNSDGSVDTAFDTNSRWLADAGALDSSGRFVIGGYNLGEYHVARLNRDFPPSLDHPVGLVGSALITLRGHAGATYVLQASSNLVHWQSIQTNVASNCLLEFIDPNAASLPQRFHRSIQLTP